MAIHSVHVGNFKGVAEPLALDIKPITLFIGPNSSGQSSMIHALAALAQTVSLPNNTRPLVLDDEFAYVHLGRFIEIIHSKKYDDAITLGLAGEDGTSRYLQKEKTLTHASGQTKAYYTFKSTRRTQDIYLDTASVSMGDLTFTATKDKEGYTVTNGKTKHHIKSELGNGFSFDRASFDIGRMSFYEFQPLFTTQRLIEQQLRKTLYLGPFRQPPIRRYPTRGSAPKEVGPRGEAAITLLANEMVQTKTRHHTKQISEWFELMGLAKTLGVARVGSSDLFDVNITLNDGKKFPLADLGYGFSQILPVLAQLSFAPEGSTLLFEQPELHLHTLAVRPLAKVFIQAQKNTKSHIVAETHSREMFGAFLTEMRNGNLDPAKFIAYKVVRESGSTKISPIEIDLETFDVYQEWEKGLTKE